MRNSLTVMTTDEMQKVNGGYTLRDYLEAARAVVRAIQRVAKEIHKLIPPKGPQI